MSQTKAQLVGGVGISTAENVVVGSAVTINSTGIDVVGVITATSFSGDGSGLSNTGSTLSAAAGSQRVVVTTQTSGTMTASATDGDLTYDANSDTLNTANLHVTGISTLGSTNGIGKVTIGIGTTALLVEGNARVTGILTVGPASVTIDGVNNKVVVGSAVTLSSGGITVGVVTASNVSVASSITATTFYGDGSGLTGAGSNICNDTSTNATYYPVFATATSGSLSEAKVSSTKLTYNPSTGVLRPSGIQLILGAGTPLGQCVEGGYLICKSGSVGWIVASEITQVSRSWYCRNDANTVAQSATGCTGWFVPTCSQLQNPGYVCRYNWDTCLGSGGYWSSTEFNDSRAYYLCGCDGLIYNFSSKTGYVPVRSFRCVTY